MNSATEETLLQIKSVMTEYSGQRLTIRQIYYRLVADHGMENSTNSYKRIVRILSEARLSGAIPYDAIEDRTREISEFDRFDYQRVSEHMKDLRDYITRWVLYYNVPKWHGQPRRVVVMVEKQDLQGIFEDVCKRWEVDLMVCRGYPSLTQQWELTERMSERINVDQELHIVYFGDFDPSGENIPEKMEERLRFDFDLSFRTFDKIALTMEQVDDWGIPPAPAKSTDTRTAGFVDKYGVGIQVELDAIKPDHLVQLIEASISRHYDEDIGRRTNELRRNGRERINGLISEIDIDGLVEKAINDEEGAA